MNLFFLPLILLGLMNAGYQQGKTCLGLGSKTEPLIKLNEHIDKQVACIPDFIPASSNAWVFYAHGYPGPIALTPQEAYEDFNSYRHFLPFEKELHVYAPGFDFSRETTSMSQEYDAHQLKRHLEGYILKKKQLDPEKPLICIGHSNGASTLLATLCMYPEIAEHISLIILLAPFASITNNTYRRFFSSDAAMARAVQVAMAPRYSHQKKSPVEWIETQQLRRNMPIVLIHAQDDSFIPVSNFYQLQDAFLNNGYTKLLASTIPVGNHQFNVKKHDLADLYEKAIEYLLEWAPL